MDSADPGLLNLLADAITPDIPSRRLRISNRPNIRREKRESVRRSHRAKMKRQEASHPYQVISANIPTERPTALSLCHCLQSPNVRRQVISEFFVSDIDYDFICSDNEVEKYSDLPKMTQYEWTYLRLTLPFSPSRMTDEFIRSEVAMLMEHRKKQREQQGLLFDEDDAVIAIHPTLMAPARGIVEKGLPSTGDAQMFRVRFLASGLGTLDVRDYMMVKDDGQLTDSLVSPHDWRLAQPAVDIYCSHFGETRSPELVKPALSDETLKDAIDMAVSINHGANEIDYETTQTAFFCLKLLTRTGLQRMDQDNGRLRSPLQLDEHGRIEQNGSYKTWKKT